LAIPQRLTRSALHPSLRAGRVVTAEAFARLRRRLALEGCKWDPQVGDTSTIAPHPLLIDPSTLAHLFTLATALARETLAAEEELATRPELHATLGIPRVLQRLWSRRPPTPPPRSARLLRFDFHPTTEGWRVSEVNSDVAGGFAESSLLPALFLPSHEGATCAADPARAWTERIAAQASPLRVALVSAPGFMEDQQVVSFLARSLERSGCQAMLARVEDLVWRDGTAMVLQGGQMTAVGAVVRFLQAEWLLPWPRPRGWRSYFQETRTPVFNAGTAILTESKRLPLVWDQLRVPTPTWRALLPESRHPATVPLTEDGWMLKGAFSNNGDAVVGRDDGVRWTVARRAAARQPTRWVAQRQFEPLVLETPLGPRFPCLGVYTLGEEAIGVYGRLSVGRTIDHRAMDAAVLVKETLS
jgi:hypothetical protein